MVQPVWKVTRRQAPTTTRAFYGPQIPTASGLEQASAHSLTVCFHHSNNDVHFSVPYPNPQPLCLLLSEWNWGRGLIGGELSPSGPRTLKGGCREPRCPRGAFGVPEERRAEGGNGGNRLCEVHLRTPNSIPDSEAQTGSLRRHLAAVARERRVDPARVPGPAGVAYCGADGLGGAQLGEPGPRGPGRGASLDSGGPHDLRQAPRRPGDAGP